MVGPEALSSRDNQSLGKVPPHSLEAEEALNVLEFSNRRIIAG